MTDRLIPTQVRLTAQSRDALSAAAKERQVSVSFLVQAAIERFLADLVPVEELRPSQWRLGES